MNKFFYKMKNLFKSKEQIELEARMRFNRDRREFQRYYKELDASIKNFSKMAQDAELSGNHANAVSCAKFVTKLQKTQIRVQGLLQRFEMMFSMQRLTGVMTRFMNACTEMGFIMDRSINLKKMWKNTAEMTKALSKLDAMSEQMDMVFEAVDAGLSESGETPLSEEENENEAEAMLEQIMGRYNNVNIPVQAAAQTSGTANEAASPSAENSDTEERLQKMLQDLKG